MTSANKSLEKKKIEIVIKQLVHASYEARGKFGGHSPNFPRASYLDERTLMYEPIVNWDKKQDNIKRNVVHQDYISGRLRAPDPHT